MKLLNPNIPLSNFINTILNEKNKQIKENILLGDIHFPKILFYSRTKEENTFKSPSHISFLKNLNRQRQLSEIREEKLNLEKKVNMANNQLLNIKNFNSFPNKINYNERYINTNLNNIKTKSKNSSKSKSSNNSSKSKNKNNSLSSERKNNNNISSLPTLGKDRKQNKRLQNIILKPIEIKSFKSNSKVNNHETEEKLEKDAKAFIQKINKRKKNILAMINKKHEKFSLKLKRDIEKMERQKKLKLDEINKNNNLYDNMNYYKIKNYSNNKKEENKYSPDNSGIKSYKNKKYYHYSPYDYRNPKMLKNLSKDLLNFNSELYYNNNIPDIIQYQYILAPLYRNNMMNKIGSTPLINIDDIDNFRNNYIPDITNGEIGGNISGLNNYSILNDESNLDSNMIDNSFNKKHLYYFNEPKYEIELSAGEIEMEKTNKNNNLINEII